MKESIKDVVLRIGELKKKSEKYYDRYSKINNLIDIEIEKFSHMDFLLYAFDFSMYIYKFNGKNYPGFRLKQNKNLSEEEQNSLKKFFLFVYDFDDREEPQMSLPFKSVNQDFFFVYNHNTKDLTLKVCSITDVYEKISNMIDLILKSGNEVTNAESVMNTLILEQENALNEGTENLICLKKLKEKFK